MSEDEREKDELVTSDPELLPAREVMSLIGGSSGGLLGGIGGGVPLGASPDPTGTMDPTPNADPTGGAGSTSVPAAGNDALSNALGQAAAQHSDGGEPQPVETDSSTS